MRPSLQSLLDCAVAAAQAAGEHAADEAPQRRGATVAVAAHDVKLELDIECQRIAEEIIRGTFPHHALLGEEDSAEKRAAAPSESDFQWVIDPIDGTINFSHGLPQWCCSIAVLHKGVAVAGAVFSPEMNELYCATRDSAATRNGVAIRVSDVQTLDKAMVFTGLDRSATPDRHHLSLLRRISARVQRARIMGSAALDLCHVACGQAEAYFEDWIYLWDIAAAGLIVQQAGGRTEILRDRGDHCLAFLASNGHVHEDIKNTLLTSDE